MGSIAELVSFRRPGRIAGDRMLHKLETFALFAAVMLAIVLEGGCVYWLWAQGQLRSTTRSSSALIGDSTNLLRQWTGATLPQCWLIGALPVLLYRLVRMIKPPHSWESATSLQNRHDLLRLWRWVMALALLEGLGMYLGGLGTLP